MVNLYHIDIIRGPALRVLYSVMSLRPSLRPSVCPSICLSVRLSVRDHLPIDSFAPLGPISYLTSGVPLVKGFEEIFSAEHSRNKFF